MNSVSVTGHLLSRAEWLAAVVAERLIDGTATVHPKTLSEPEAGRHLAGGGQLVLVYDTAASCLGVAFSDSAADDVPPVQGLIDDWCRGAQAMLHLSSRFPAQCLLINGAAAARFPDRFLAEASHVLGLGLKQIDAAKAAASAADDMSPLVRALADATAAARSDVVELFMDLESCAHVGSDPSVHVALTFDEVWKEYAASKSQRLAAMEQAQAYVNDAAHTNEILEECRVARSSAERRLDGVMRERDRHIAASADAAREVKRIIAEGNDVSALANRFRRESETLLSQLHLAHLESESFFDQVAKQAGQLSELQNERSVLKKDHASTAGELTSLRFEGEQARRRTVQQDADIARLQVAALESRQLAAGARVDLDAFLRFWQAHHPAVVSIDLRKDFAGDNWHAAEFDGRWTGPETLSTLTLPALAPGRYRVELALVGSITAEIGTGMQLALNDQPLSLVFNRVKHPRTAMATFTADGSDGNQWRLAVKVPAVASPAERRSADSRLLGVRIGEVKFTAVAKE